MSQEISLRGVFPPIPTPFDGQGDVAFGARVNQELAYLHPYDSKQIGAFARGRRIRLEGYFSSTASARQSILEQVRLTRCKEVRDEAILV